MRFVPFFDGIVVIPAKAGIQALNGIARLARDSQKLLAGGSAPAPWVTFFARAKKVTKESTPPDGATPSLRFSPESALASTRRALTTRLGLKHEARFSRFQLRCSGAPYGVLKTPPRTGLRWVAQTPVGASRAPSQAGGIRETFDRARGALFSARRVRLAPGRCEVHRGPRGVYAAKRPGRILFGDFLLCAQEKVTCRGSATHKYASPQATQDRAQRAVP